MGLGVRGVSLLFPLGSPCSCRPAPAVRGVQGGGGGKVEEKGHRSPAGSSGSAVLCPGTVVQSGRSKFKELRDVEVSSNNRGTSNGQSLTDETRSCFKKK